VTILCEILADFLMLAHALYSSFVFFGFVPILAGMALAWRWTSQRWFRVLHLSATMFIVARVWIGVPCPFSAAEDGLRRNTTGACFLGNPFHETLHRLAFRGGNPRRFARSVSLFGGLVAATFVLDRFMPLMTKRRRREAAQVPVR
jgi:polyferredoxin